MYAYQPRVGESRSPLGGSDLGLRLPPLPGFSPILERGNISWVTEGKCCWGTDLGLRLYLRSVRPGAEKCWGVTDLGLQLPPPLPQFLFLGVWTWV